MSSKNADVKKSGAGTASVSADGGAFRHWSLVCIGILFLVTVLFFSSFIFSDSVLASVNSDQLANIDMKELDNVSLRQNGQVPAWFSTRLGGMPAIDAMFGDALYPPSMIVRLFTPAYRSFGFVMVIHVFLAGLFFFLMLRKSFGVARLAAFAGALFYMLSPQFVSHVNPGHDGKMIVISWLPYVVWRLRSLLSLPSLRNAALMAIGIAMMILSPHVQMTYFVLMGVFLYWVADIVKTIVEKNEKKLVAGKAAYFWISVFIGMGASFIVFYPSYMFVKDAFSVRGVDRGFEFATSWAMGWAEFFSLWVHEFGNALEYYWGKNYFKLNTEYAGAIPLLLAVLAVVSKPKSFWRLFWAGVAVLAVLYSLGANTPFFKAAYYLVPGVKRFRAPSMIMFWFTFSTALMSVFFIKDLLSKRFDIYGKQQRKWTVGLAAALGCVTLIALIFSVESFTTGFASSMMGGAGAVNVFHENFSQKFVPNLWLWWLFAAVTLGMLIAVVNGKLAAGVLVYSLIVMGMIDTIKVNKQFYAVGSPQQYFYDKDKEPALRELSAEFAKAPFRVFSLRGTYPLQQNQDGVYGLEGIGGFHDNELICYRAFRGDQSDSHYLGDIVEMTRDGQMRLSMAKITGPKPFLDLAGVDYILMASGTGKINKIKNPTSLGRLSYAPDFTVLPEENIVDALRVGYYDYVTTVALLEEPELPFARKQSGADTVDANQRNNGAVDTALAGNADNSANGANDGQVNNKSVDKSVKRLKAEWKKYTPNLRIAAVTMPGDGFLRISEVYYPGWSIKVDGAPVKYYRSDMAWTAVPLKAGSYEIIMEPKSLYMGFASKVSAVFILIIAGILAYGVVRKRLSKSPPSPQKP